MSAIVKSNYTCILLQVMIQRLNATGHLYSTCSEVGIEQHEGCTCGCRISESDCHANQVRTFWKLNVSDVTHPLMSLSIAVL